MFKSLLVFGDSLSDNGLENSYGFTRYSNGRVWPEYLVEKLGAERPDVRAFGGATSGMGNYNPPAPDWSGLLWQVEHYVPDSDLTETLVAVEIGFNDLHDPASGIKPGSVVDNVVKALKMLAGKGAVNFLVWDLFTSPVSPGYLDENGPEYEYYKNKIEKAHDQFREYNLLLEPALDHFQREYPAARLHFFKASSAIPAIAERFGNTTTIWPGTGHFAEKDHWFWYDHWHFMTDVHRHIADEVFQLLKDRTE